MVQSGRCFDNMGIFGDYLNIIRPLVDSPGDFGKYLIDIGYNKFNNKISPVMGSGLTLTNNEIEYIIKVLKSLENRGILLK